MNSKLTLLALGCLVAAIAPLQAQNLLLNGGFESGGFDNWTIGGDTSFTGVTQEVNVNGIDYVPQEGTYLLQIGSTSLFNLSQSFDTTLGEDYQLTFYLASDGATPNQFIPSVSVGGGTSLDGTLSDLAALTTPTISYSLYTYNFTADSLSTTLTLSGSAQGYLALDNISVIDLGTNSGVGPADVPEPSTWTSILAGMAGLYFVHRWRRLNALKS